MRQRLGNGPRCMTVKLLNSKEDPEAHADELCVLIDQVALVLPLGRRLVDALSTLERSPQLDLAVAYESHATRDASSAAIESQRNAHLRRLGFVRGRPGIGWPSAVHLERCAAPARTIVSNTPSIAALGGIGMLALALSDDQMCEVIATGRLRWQTPQVLQVILSGRLSPCVATRDIALELLRRGIAEKVAALSTSQPAPVVLEFSGPGLHTLTVTDRALLCSMAEDVGATSALSVSDDRTETYLRDQRRSKAFRQLTSDAGAPCADALCLDLSTVVPLVALDSGVISPAAELAQVSVREVMIGADHSVGLRDLLSAAAWFKTKRISAEVDVIIVPPTRQIVESMSANGALSQLLSAGARLLEPDARLVDGSLHLPPSEGKSLRNFSVPFHARCRWSVASVDTLCTSAMSGVIQDPRIARKAPRISIPRELPVDDSLLFDKRPATTATVPPPPSEIATKIGSSFPLDPVPRRSPPGHPEPMV